MKKWFNLNLIWYISFALRPFHGKMISIQYVGNFLFEMPISMKFPMAH